MITFLEAVEKDDARHDPTRLRTVIVPPRGSSVPADMLRTDVVLSVLSVYDDPLLRAILDSVPVKDLINHPVIDRAHTIPYGAGGSVPEEKPTTFVDYQIPRSFTVGAVTFDPADPWVIHENSEQAVMEVLISAGWEADAAYRFAHYCVAEVLEGYWYEAHGIDRAAAEKLYKPWLNETQYENADYVPPDLYNKPYPHGCEQLARLESAGEAKPSDQEIADARKLLSLLYLAPPKGSLSPMGLNPRGDDVEKTMTVGSVHVPTALGNQPKNGSLDARRRKTFKEAISVAYAPEDTEKRFDVDIRKTDADKMQIFGWASVSTVNGQLIVDKQGDIIPVDEIEKAAYDFVQFSRDMGDMHSRMGTGRMIESVVCTKEKAACGLRATNDKGEPVEGWWVGFQVADPECWRAIKSGAQPELSIGGRASWTDDAA